VSFDQEILLHKLAELVDLAGKPDRFVVAFSGGLDSTVLLHALVSSRNTHQIQVLAVHIDHGLHDDSASWSKHCESFSASLGVECVSANVDVDADSGQGTEAAAREARYGAFRSLLQAGDWLLSAHHKDDQAETLLLNLMRGSGPAGLAGIGEIRPFGAGWLVRPLLSTSRTELRDYAGVHSLAWIDDPSNEDQQFDRNYLRQEIMPRFDARWPDVANRLRRSAYLSGEASQLLDQLADADLSDMGERPDRLALSKLRQLPPERQRNLLRYVVRELGLPSPPSTRLESIITDLIHARDDAQPLVQWPGAEIRRYRGKVYILPAADMEGTPHPISGLIGENDIPLQGGLGELSLEPGAPLGLAQAVIERGIEVRYRDGGEEIRPAGQPHTRKLKKLLQEEGIVPWMRDRLPLLYSAGELVAVADLWIADNAVGEPGTAIRWQNRPAIH
jgi:tRNA(Ile)-lysidine synthase